MKEMHRLIVTSETYKLASAAEPRRCDGRPQGRSGRTRYFWHFPLQRLEAEPIWDSIFAAAGTLDLAVGGPSFDIGASTGRRGRRGEVGRMPPAMPAGGLHDPRLFDRAATSCRASCRRSTWTTAATPCPLRTQTVTAPQALFLMNSDGDRQGDRAHSPSGSRRNPAAILTAAVDLGLSHRARPAAVGGGTRAGPGVPATTIRPG